MILNDYLHYKVHQINRFYPLLSVGIVSKAENIALTFFLTIIVFITVFYVNLRNLALRIAGSSFTLIVLVSFLLVYLGCFGKAYLCICLPFDIWIMILNWKLIKSKTSAEGYSYMWWIYLSVLLEIILFLIFQFVFKKSIYF